MPLVWCYNRRRFSVTVKTLLLHFPPSPRRRETMGSGNENEVSRVGEATKYLNGAFTFQSLRRIRLRSSYCISKFKRITSTVSTMRERRKSQENDKRRRKSKVCSDSLIVFLFIACVKQAFIENSLNSVGLV